MSRRLGVLVVFGVPAIVGGGIVYALFGHSWIAVGVFEAALYAGAAATAFLGVKKTDGGH